MHVNIDQQDLLPAVQAVSRSVGIRSTLPVLANILLETENGKLKFSATNLEIGVVKRINAEVVVEGSISVPAKVFLETISSLPSTKIELEAQGEKLKISTTGFKGNIAGISASEFPAIPLASTDGIFLDANVFKKAIPQIAFAAATDEGRPVLTGILTEIKQNTLELVATDGFRLAHKKVVLQNGGDFKALIPRRTFEEIVRLIDEEVGKEIAKIQIATSENQNQLIFKVGQTEVSSRLIEGNFPVWEKIIPQKFENRTVIDKQLLLKALKLSSVFAKDAANITKIETDDGKIRLSSQTKELGEQQTEVEAQVEGSKIVIAFNSRFLIEALSANSASQLSIEFSGNLSPALIKPIGDEGLEYIVMPIRIN